MALEEGLDGQRVRMGVEQDVEVGRRRTDAGERTHLILAPDLGAQRIGARIEAQLAVEFRAGRELLFETLGAGRILQQNSPARIRTVQPCRAHAQCSSSKVVWACTR